MKTTCIDVSMTKKTALAQRFEFMPKKEKLLPWYIVAVNVVQLLIALPQ